MQIISHNISSLRVAAAETPLLQLEDMRDILCVSVKCFVPLNKVLVGNQQIWQK
jgi:hypothetical protein